MFDDVAADYEAQLARGISASGESRDYFAQGRIRWLRRSLLALGYSPRRVLDYGCGTGSTTPLLLKALGAERAIGVDVSLKSLEIARAAHGSERVTYAPIGARGLDEPADLAYCNGVFHHIPPHQRRDALDYIRRSLGPPGYFSFWENNPWNPGTRVVMRRIPFDRDAITLSPPEARRLLRGAGFEILRTDSQFFFPRVLRWLRWMEPTLAHLPFGAQYHVLCRLGTGPAGAFGTNATA